MTSQRDTYGPWQGGRKFRAAKQRRKNKSGEQRPVMFDLMTFDDFAAEATRTLYRLWQKRTGGRQLSTIDVQKLKSTLVEFFDVRR